ncbi:MAG: hypothetical protein A2X94_13285 [Bdellovibrionales bacterium GWB1_55_8]|nr:MAG: hypothetical protein A2X94_13285 [Bdellovibrionales bacterium GWB1_55_8]
MSFFAASRSAIALVVFTVIAGGCSTVSPMGSGRTGLLDRLGKADGGRRPAAVLISEMKKKGLALQWPIEMVHVTSMYGSRGKNVHEGIDLRARTGTPVLAAESGVVLFAGQRLRGYGKMIVIRHRERIATVYAHNSKLLVRVGQRVRRGQKIALSGNSGRSSGPHVHFEVRNGVEAVDPWEVLPDPTTLAKRTSMPRGLANSR